MSHLIEGFGRSRVDPDSLVLEGVLEEGEDQRTFRVDVRVE